MIKSKQFYIRKVHRYLGLLLGIQFLLWTIGGLYFSWSNMDEVHGDFEKKEAPLLSSNIALVSPSIILDSIKKIHTIDSVVSIQLIEMLGKPFYQIRCISAIHHEVNHQQRMTTMNHLANAETGALRSPLTEKEAIEVAKNHFNGEPIIKEVAYITNTDAHHEYREQPLPAYAITFEHASNATVYVASELGTVQKFRNNKWRIFDLLWMMHTMDYKGRDNFGNILLRAFSFFGLITVISGFTLYFVSSRKFKK
ncbi:MAG: hypothetical protein M0Q26_11770 [Chitinophagaceae bacterium]|nr:hypothetical protein [Chitinophagaceae bacterium]